MGELGELLELLHAPPTGFECVRAEFRDWTHRERSHQAFLSETEEAESDAAEVWSGYAPMIAGGGDAAAGVSDDFERISRIWLDGDDRVRLETANVASGSVVQVRAGNRWWSYDEANGALSGNDRDGGIDVGGEIRSLLRPGRLMAALRFEPLGPGERAGRATVQALARPRPREGHRDPFIDQYELHGLGVGATEYMLDVDAATGSLLRVEARLMDEPFSIKQAVQIAYDEPIPDERFAFEPPPGEVVREFSEREHPRMIGAREAAKVAPFRVFVLPRPPNGWELHATLWPGRERPKSPPGVLIGYLAEDGTAGLSLTQTAAGEGTDLISLDPDAADRIERDGQEILVRRRGNGLAMSAIKIEREGTGIFMTSDAFTLDELVQMALSLKPVAP